MNPEGGSASTGHNHVNMDTGSGNEHSASEAAGQSKVKVRDSQTASGTNKGSSDVGIEFRQQLLEVYNAYLPMKDAFVASESEQVERNAGKVQSALEAVDMELLEGDAHMQWMSQLNTLKPAIDKISASENIEEQRTAFAAFNTAFYSSIKTFGLARGIVYYQYCPMAIGEKGAFWLSSIKEIRNPYYGEAMMSCGETRETLDY